MLKKLTFIILISASFVSCSSLKKEKAEPEKEITKVVVKDMAEAGKEMDLLIEKAISSSKESRDYLATDLYIKGNDASMRGDSSTAAFLFKYVQKLEPKDLYIKKKYAIELIRIGSLEESKNLLQEVFEEEAHSDETTGLILGGVYTALDDAPNALSTYQKVAKNNPESEEACVFLSKAYASEEAFKKALNQLSRCEKKIKGKGIFSYYKGKINLSRNKRKIAMRNFRSSLKQDPSYYQSAVALGLLYEEAEKFNKAKEIYENFLIENPMNYAVLTRVVQVKFATEDYKNIIDYAERLSSLDSNDLNLKVRLGILYTDKKRYEDAKGIFKEVLVAIPDSDKVLYYLGSLYLQTGDHEGALSYFNKVDSESSLFHDSHLQMAQILSHLANENEVHVSRFKEFVHKKSKQHEKLEVELKVLLATFYENKNEYMKSIELVRALRKKESYTENHDYYLASLYEKVKHYVEARNVIEEILAKNPDNAHALNFLGYSLLEQNEDLDKALVYIKRAVASKPDDGFIRDSLGWYYYKTGNLELALIEVKKAWEAVKTDVVISKHLAIIYEELHRYEEAKKYYNEALKNCTVQSEKEEVQRALEKLDSKRLPASE